MKVKVFGLHTHSKAAPSDGSSLEPHFSYAFPLSVTGIIYSCAPKYSCPGQHWASVLVTMVADFQMPAVKAYTSMLCCLWKSEAQEQPRDMGRLWLCHCSVLVTPPSPGALKISCSPPKASMPPRLPRKSLTKKSQQSLECKMHCPAAGLLARLQNHFFLPYLAQIKSCKQQSTA